MNYEFMCLSPSLLLFVVIAMDIGGGGGGGGGGGPDLPPPDKDLIRALVSKSSHSCRNCLLFSNGRAVQLLNFSP